MSLEYGDSVEILTSMITLIWEERKQTITANLTLKKNLNHSVFWSPTRENHQSGSPV